MSVSLLLLAICFLLLRLFFFLLNPFEIITLIIQPAHATIKTKNEIIREDMLKGRNLLCSGFESTSNASFSSLNLASASSLDKQAILAASRANKIIELGTGSALPFYVCQGGSATQPSCRHP